ncbi:hypothetical protein FBQ97_07350 [Acidobacteria bacterium ACD]|nr:MAG: hypothetical protein EDX89_01090 [Acidobacteriota bacterium]MDL1949614.1 hypothetical protein [Acidobacteria bacterium ACD]
MRARLAGPAPGAWAGLLLVLALGPLAAAPPAPAPPSEAPARGLAFAVALTKEGRSHSSETFDLRVPGAKGPLRLALEQLTYEGGTLHAVARVTNATGGAVGGLRLSLRGVSDARGEVAVAPFAPLELGDLEDGATSAGVVFRVGPLSLEGRPEPVVVLGDVSGIASVATVEVPGVAGAGAIGLDAEGRLLVADAPGKRILRADAEGKGTVEVARLSCAPTGVTASREGDVLYASCDGSPGLLRLPRSGAKPVPVETPGSLALVRSGPDGALRAVSGSSLLRLGEPGRAPVSRLRAAGAVVSFDVRPDGSVRLVAGPPGRRGVFSAREGESGLRPLGGAAASLPRASACRFGPDGLYVAEGTGAPEAAPRLVVLDDAGSLLREARVLAGPVTDLAFGRDGRLHVLLEGGAASRVQLLQLF